MPISVSCRSCKRKGTKVWVKQWDVEVLRCQSCREIIPFARSYEKDARFDIDVARYKVEGNVNTAELIGSLAWEADSQEFPLNLHPPFDFSIQEMYSWLVGWHGRDLLELDILPGPTIETVTVQAYTGLGTMEIAVASAHPSGPGQKEMDRLWAEMAVKADEPWDPPDRFDCKGPPVLVTGLQLDGLTAPAPPVVESVTEDERTP